VYEGDDDRVERSAYVLTQRVTRNDREAEHHCWREKAAVSTNQPGAADQNKVDRKDHRSQLDPGHQTMPTPAHFRSDEPSRSATITAKMTRFDLAELDRVESGRLRGNRLISNCRHRKNACAGFSFTGEPSNLAEGRGASS
jgi:hypothetical protein